MFRIQKARIFVLRLGSMELVRLPPFKTKVKTVTNGQYVNSRLVQVARLFMLGF